MTARPARHARRARRATGRSAWTGRLQESQQRPVPESSTHTGKHASLKAQDTALACCGKVNTPCQSLQQQALGMCRLEVQTGILLQSGGACCTADKPAMCRDNPLTTSSRDLRASLPAMPSGHGLNIRRWLLTGSSAASGPLSECLR